MITSSQITQQRMYDIIASSFFQKKSCRLPGIGSLSLVTHPAQPDFSNTQIKAPIQEIIFNATNKDAAIFNEFSAISQLMKISLDEEGIVELTGIGTFTKDSEGTINFLSVEMDTDFTQPVTAKRVIHKDAAHNILVGDKETTNVVMTEYYSDEAPAAKDRWWIWAIVLGVIGASLLAFYLYQHGVNSFGNAHKY